MFIYDLNEGTLIKFVSNTILAREGNVLDGIIKDQEFYSITLTCRLKSTSPKFIIKLSIEEECGLDTWLTRSLD
jgi:hypothetical protein